jgi:hypothetical protein
LPTGISARRSSTRSAPQRWGATATRSQWSTIGARRFGEPFREYLQAVRCRAALIFGERSALVSRTTASYMSMRACISLEIRCRYRREAAG